MRPTGGYVVGPQVDFHNVLIPVQQIQQQLDPQVAQVVFGQMQPFEPPVALQNREQLFVRVVAELLGLEPQHLGAGVHLEPLKKVLRLLGRKLHLQVNALALVSIENLVDTETVYYLVALDHS